MTPSEKLIRRQYPAEEAERRIRKLRAQRRCVDCGVDTCAIGEFYMVNESVWEQGGVGQDYGKMICIGCLERRIGRELCRADFLKCPLNDEPRARISARLRDRYGRGKPCSPLLQTLELNLLHTTEEPLRQRLLAAINAIRARS